MPAEELCNHSDHNTTAHSKPKSSLLTVQSEPDSTVSRRPPTATTDIVSLRSRIAAGIRHKQPRHIEVAVLTRSQKSCATILITAQHETVGDSRDQNKTKRNSSQRVTERTYLVSLRSRIAAGDRHKPSRHIKMAVITCQQKRCSTILITTPHTKQNHRSLNHRMKHNFNNTTTDFVSLRSRIAAGVRHKPSRHIKMALDTRRQKGCVTILIVETTRNSRTHLTITTNTSSHTQSDSDN
jgi:hypothetical protein